MQIILLKKIRSLLENYGNTEMTERAEWAENAA